jgi:hypothetical protein
LTVVDWRKIKKNESLGIMNLFRLSAKTSGEENGVLNSKTCLLAGLGGNFGPKVGDNSHFRLFEWRGRGLNPRPRAYESPALPLSYLAVL